MKQNKYEDRNSDKDKEEADFSSLNGMMMMMMMMMM